jgi:hypothetical protein
MEPFMLVAPGGLRDPGSSGLLVRSALNTLLARTLTAPAAGITVSNGDGVSGNPTLALANDLAALEAMAGTGLVARTASETYAQRTITGTANKIVVTNGDGVSGAPALNTGSLVVHTDQANTWSTGAQDMSAATSHLVPVSAGYAPTVDGSIGFDSTQKKYVSGSTTSGNTGSFPRVLSFQQSTSDTVANVDAGATTGSGKAFATTYTIPANTLRTGKVLRLSVGFLYNSPASSASVQFRVRINGVDICKSSANTASSITSLSMFAQYIIWGTAAPGASVSVGCMAVNGTIVGGGAAGFAANTIGPEVSGVTTNANETLDMTILYGANTPTPHNYSMRFMMIEELN